MSPRRNRRRVDAPGPEEVRGAAIVERWVDGEWHVRTVPGETTGLGRRAASDAPSQTGRQAVKAYRCPGCEQEIRPGVAHVVAWPADGRGDLDDRRHWHTGCWRARDRRTPQGRINR